MSSIVAHAITGFTAYKAGQKNKSALIAPALACVFLAIAPDFDYLGIWYFGLVEKVRITHSLLFAFVASSVMWFVLRRFSKSDIGYLPLLLASLSHPLMDLLVGAHPVPLLWPWPHPYVSIPFGILPSAGKLKLHNIYLWRNLLIELCIVLPVAYAIVKWAQDKFTHRVCWLLLLVSPLWLFALTHSIHLAR